MSPECPEPILSLAEAAAKLPLAQAIAQRAKWTNSVEQCLREDAGDVASAIWSYFWSQLNATREDPQTALPTLLLFLLVCCRSVYAVRYVFAHPTDVLGRLLPSAAILTQALDEAASDDTRQAREEAISAVSAALQANAQNHIGDLCTVLGSQRWTFDGSTMLFGGIAKLRVRAILTRLKQAEQYEDFRRLLQYADDSESECCLADLLRRAAAGAWPRIGPRVQDIWFEAVFSDGAVEPAEIISFYPSAGQDGAWFRRAAEALEDTVRPQSHLSRPDMEQRMRKLCAGLIGFERPMCDGSRALLDVLSRWAPGSSAGDDRFWIGEQVLDASWETFRPGDDGLLLPLLWHEKRLWSLQRERHYWDRERSDRWESACRRVRESPHGATVSWLVDRLLELGDSRYSYGLGKELGPEERAAWRAEVTSRLSQESEVRWDACEFLLWCASGAAADEAEMVVLDLTQTEEEITRIRSLYDHVSRAVQLRARAVVELREGTAGPVLKPEPASPRSLSATVLSLSGAALGPHDGRTWIGDRTVEELIRGATARVESRFCSEYPDTWRSDEEALLAHLLSSLQSEFVSVTRLLRDAETHGLAQPIDMRLEYRQISKSEEGGRGVGAGTFGVDVAFLVRVEAGGLVRAERATLVQCKKLAQGGDTGRWQPSFDIDAGQRDDLIAQTESSFYLFLVPRFIRDECWVTPARLVRTMMEAANTKGRLPRRSAGLAGRSLAHWLTFDLLGLWIGDERREMIRKATGERPGAAPRFLVEVDIRLGHHG